MLSKVIIYDARKDKQNKKWAVSTSATDAKKEPRIRECSFLSYSLIMQPYSASMSMLHAYNTLFIFVLDEGKIAFISIVNAVPAVFSSHLNSYVVTTTITKHQISFVNGSVLFFNRQMRNANLMYFNRSDDWITNLEFWLQWMRSKKKMKMKFNWSYGLKWIGLPSFWNFSFNFTVFLLENDNILLLCSWR